MPIAELYMDLQGPSGPIAGDCEAQDFEGQIMLTDWAWKSDAAEDGAKKMTPGGFEFSKYVDRSSTVLLNALSKGTVLPRATITLHHRIDEGMTVVVILQRVRVASVSLNLKNGDTSVEMTEEWTFDYETFTLENQIRGKQTVGEMVFTCMKKPSYDLPKPQRQPPEDGKADPSKSVEAMAEKMKQMEKMIETLSARK